MFYCEFFEAFKNTFFIEMLRCLLQKNLSNLPCQFSKSFRKHWQKIYITYFPCFKKMHTFLFIKTNKFYFMFTLFRFFAIWFWNVLNLFLICSGQWINFDNYTLIQMTAWLIRTQTNSDEIVFQMKMNLKWNHPNS